MEKASGQRTIIALGLLILAELRASRTGESVEKTLGGGLLREVRDTIDDLEEEWKTLE